MGVVGNLEGLLEVLHMKGVGSPAFWAWVDVKGLAAAPASPTWYPIDNWWWWRASRVIHDVVLGQTVEVIDEFPFFSFMLGDMHPHVLALPFVLLALGLALNLLFTHHASRITNYVSRFTFYEWLLMALILGGLGFLNTWDFPIYLFVVAGAYAMWRYRHHGRASDDWFREIGYAALGLLVLGFALYLPFYVGFQSQAGGLRPVLLVKTRLHQYLIMFGLFIYVALGLLTAELGAWWRARRGSWLQRDVLIVGGVAVILVDAFVFLRWWLAALLVTMLAATALVLWWRVQPPSEETAAESSTAAPLEASTVFALLLIFTALLLTLSVEFVYLRDTFGSRMNTVFKFYYQAWVMLAIASAYGVYRLTNLRISNHESRITNHESRNTHYVSRFTFYASRFTFHASRLWLLGFAVLLAASLIYPVAAAYTKAGYFKGQPTLDGTAWVKKYYPDDYAAIQWLRAHVPDQAVVLEASGPQYSFYARVSTHTGLPTVLGWGGHELQWRGNYDEAGRREPEIAAIYQNLDRNQVTTLLEKYGVEYVYVGQLEREKYQLSPPMIEKFGRFMDLVYEQGNVRIYQVRG